MTRTSSTASPPQHPTGDLSPWTEIVRGVGLESTPYPSSSVGEEAVVGGGEGLVDGGDNGGKKTVWDKPVLSDVAVEVVPLMGVAAWPALSESTKGSPKVPASDGSSSVQQGIGMTTSSSSQRHGNNTNTNSSSLTNQPAPTRQRSFRQGNGGSSGNPSNMARNGSFSVAPPSHGFGVESAPNNTGRPANSGSPSVEYPKETGVQRGGGFGPQSNGGGEQQRNSYRRGTGGPHPSGEGSHYGGRRDQDRGNHYRNPQRNFGGRGAQMQPQRASTRPFTRGPPPVNTSFVPPPPMLMHPSFGTPMVYPGPEVFYYPGPHQDPFRAGPMVPPMGPVFYPCVDPVLQTKILNQIEYYFSPDNLAVDTFLRKNMDEQGWVSVKLIAKFNKLSQLTDNTQMILAAMQGSRVVEIEGEKMRRRGDWEKWRIPNLAQHTDAVQDSGQEMLAVHLENVALDERSLGQINENHPISSVGEFQQPMMEARRVQQPMM